MRPLESLDEEMQNADEYLAAIAMIVLVQQMNAYAFVKAGICNNIQILMNIH